MFRAKLEKAIYQAVQSYSPQRSSYIFSSLSEGDPDPLMRYGGGVRLDEMRCCHSTVKINREHHTATIYYFTTFEGNEPTDTIITSESN